MCFRKIVKNDYLLFLVSPSVRPSVRIEKLGSHWKDFHEFSYLSIFRQTVEKIQFSLKSKRITVTLHEDQYTFFIYLAQFFSEWGIFQTNFLNEIKIHFVFNKIFFENHALWEIGWKHFVQRSGPQMTIWGMHIACWITKATHTHTHTHTQNM
jgi:hypothetical protein